jgi:large subunit ribosomal protein L17
MRHKRYVKKLGVKTAHRHAMLANMATSLISVGKIRTTTARAKVLQSKVERIITLAKRGDLHARRQVISALRDGDVVKKLFNEIVPELKDMKGGYTRRALLGRRLGDGASLSIVELNIEKKVVAEPKKKKGKEDTEAKGAEDTKEAKPAKEKKPKPEKKPKAEKKPKPEKKAKVEKKPKDKKEAKPAKGKKEK